MAAFDFPSSPSVNQTYTANGVTWKWNGTMWMRVSGAGYLEKIEEGNSKVEVDDSGSGNVTVTTDGTERLRITSDGFIGIDNTSPELQSSAARNLVIGTPGSGGQNGLTICSNTSGTNNIYFGDASSGQGESIGRIVYSHADDSLRLHTAIEERLRITSAGQLLAGATAARTDFATTPHVQIEGLDFPKSSLSITRNSNDTGRPTLFFGKSRGGVDGATNIVADGDGLGTIEFAGADGDQLHRAALIAAQVDGTPTNNGMKGRLLFSTNSGGTSATERLRITSGGYVGINIASPERRLEVVETASSLTYPVAVSNFTNASTGVGAAIDFRLTTGGNTRGELGLVYAGNSNSDGTDFVFKPNDGSTGNIERLRITNDGKFGFNTTNPGAFDSGANHLVLLGNTSGTGNAGITISSGTDSYGNIYFADGTSGADAYRGHIAYNHNGNTMRFATNGSERMRITSDGDVGINQNSPSTALSVYDGQSSVNTVIRVGTNAVSSTNNGYAQIEFKHGSASSAWIWHNANSTTGFGGANSLNFYNGNAADYAFFSGGNNERFRIDSSGRVTTPGQPAFKCKLNTATGANFTGTLVFNNVSYNIGSHYNSSNGRFTAPIDGKYLLAWYTNMERAGGNGSFYADWYINGNAQGNRMYSHHSGAWEQIGGTVIFDLNANDYVHIQAMTSGNWDGGSYGSYSGCLLG